MKIQTFFLGLILTVVNCKDESTTPQYDNSIINNISVAVEGNAIYFSGGGTIEHMFPPGNRLIDCKWISPSTKTDSGFAVYLSITLDTMYLNHRLRAFGILDSIAIPWQFSNQVDYTLKIDVDSLQIVK